MVVGGSTGGGWWWPWWVGVVVVDAGLLGLGVACSVGVGRKIRNIGY